MKSVSVLIPCLIKFYKVTPETLQIKRESLYTKTVNFTKNFFNIKKMKITSTLVSKLVETPLIYICLKYGRFEKFTPLCPPYLKTVNEIKKNGF